VSELASYSESHRDRVESSPIRREIDGRSTPDYEIVLYWVKKSDLILMALTDLGRNQTLEFAVEHDKVLDAKMHPNAYIPEGMGFIDESFEI
jgi:hypothetical protein